ncbi:inactive ubiquitin carboxyl-terminal hydrolase 50 [Pseudophryne corroboree]|uniref:inactive ubiquitin carboxyl-terminal hydrolase 50 n=1 Tax=Pseudophryne corroboree TaxID=495146 RepID=UPI003081F26D
MDVTVATLTSVQWASEDYSAVKVVSSSCNLCGRCFTVKRKVKPSGRNKSGLVRPVSQVQLSKKSIFNNLLDVDLLEKVIKKINKNVGKFHRNGREAWSLVKVEQANLLEWVGDLLRSGLFGFGKKQTKESMGLSANRYLNLFPNGQLQDLSSLFCTVGNKNLTTLFQEVNQWQEGLALNFRTTYEPTEILCLTKYRVDISNVQHPSDLRAVLLVDKDTGYICNFFIYSISQVLSKAKCIPLLYIIRKLLLPFSNKNYTLQIDHSAHINEAIKEELSKIGIKLELVSQFGGKSGSALSRKNQGHTKPLLDSINVPGNVSDLDGYAIFPLNARKYNSVLCLAVFWLLVHFSCINVSVLYFLDNADLEELSPGEFAQLLSEEIHGKCSDLGFAKGNGAAYSDGDQETDSDSETECEVGPSATSCSILRNEQLKRMKGVTGLRNLGNTCYMNAVIQCLSCTTPLAEYLLSWLFETDVAGDNKEVVNAFANIMADLWFGEAQYVSSEDFWFAICNVHPSFGKKSQQDAQELLIYTLNALHEDLTNNFSRRHSTPNRSRSYIGYNVSDSVITRLFQGVLRQKTVCLECGHTSHKDDIFTVLSLPIPPGNETSLQQCLECFFQQVMLTLTDKIFCPYCKMKQDTSVKVRICKLPKILILHLKRFEYQGRVKRKLKTNVTFPLTHLDLSPFVSAVKVKHSMYSLYAVVNHSGELDFGHYTAYCKHPGTKEWNAFDDMKHFSIAESTVQTPLAYMLFYTSQTFNSPKKTSSCPV